MVSWDNPKDRVAVLQMNADLRHAQLELLSAECATDRLRLRFSTADIAQYADEATLEKAIKTVTSLSDYYTSIGQKAQRKDWDTARNNGHLNSEHAEVAEMRVSQYLRAQRELYFEDGKPLDDNIRSQMEPFFSPQLLQRVRIVELQGQRLSNPDFYEDAMRLGISNLPQIRHMSSLTFIDVIVFNETVSPRTLFHGLVHAVQFDVLGPERYVELFVRGFLRTNVHIMVPLEAQAFALDSEFSRCPEQSFSVEEQVRLWRKQERY